MPTPGDDVDAVELRADEADQAGAPADAVEEMASPLDPAEVEVEEEQGAEA